MKVLERLELVDRIARELQSRMTFSEIDTYLKAHKVDIKKPTSNVNSKWVYSKELLSDEKPELILTIASELEVPHNFSVNEPPQTYEPDFWEPFHFRLFLSHLASFKKTTSQLQAALRAYGISSFVAHVDIEPTREWMQEIEAALLSMDALAAILMPGFKESNWTDQEVGVAVGRGVLVIPIIRGLNPYGFISKYQGLHADGKTIADVAKALFKILATSPKTRSRMLACLTEATIQSVSEDEAITKIAHLASVANLPAVHLEKLRSSAKASNLLSSGKPLKKLNQLLAKNGLEAVPEDLPQELIGEDDDIPF